MSQTTGFLGAEVLPKLDHLARKQRRHVAVRIVLPDPTIVDNAIRYMAIKRGLGEAADEDTLAVNVVATVIAAILASVANPYLHIQIGLCTTVPVLRVDASSSAALLTRDAPELPAILVNSGNPYFEMVRDLVENELAQSRKVEWKKDAPVFRADSPSYSEVLAIVDGLGFSENVSVEAEKLSAKKGHRYG
jgi:hypothetical protein